MAELMTLSAALGRDGLEAGDLVATWAAVPRSTARRQLVTADSMGRASTQP